MSSTSAHAARAQDPTLANRYGVERRRPRRLGAVAGGIALLTAILLAVWLGLDTSVGRIRSKDVGYEIVDDSLARVTFQVTIPPGSAAECDVVVQDSEAAPVGFRTVRPDALPADQHTRPSDTEQTYTVDVRTVVRGVTGLVDTCRPL